MINLNINSILDKYLPSIFKPFKDIVWFIVLFVCFDLVWKLFVSSGENEESLLVFGKDITSWTYGLCLFTAKIIHWIVHSLLGYSDFVREGIILYFNREDHILINIVWSCTGIKQLLMFSFIIICYYGPKKKKLWFIPLSMVILTLVNIIRLVVVCLIVKDPFPEWFIYVNEWYNERVWENNQESYMTFYKDWFHLFHRDIFTWLYYDGILFLLWLFWEEKINKPYQRLKKMSAVK